MTSASGDTPPSADEVSQLVPPWLRPTASEMTELQRGAAEQRRVVPPNGAEICKLIRRRSGLSQRELARRAGCGSATIVRIESGTREPTLDLLVRLAAAADVPIGDMTVGPIHLTKAEWQRRARALTDVVTAAHRS